MDLTPIPATADRCIVRGQRLVQVKFVALPQEMVSDTIFASKRASLGARLKMVSDTISSFIHRVIGRLVAARP